MSPIYTARQFLIGIAVAIIVSGIAGYSIGYRANRGLIGENIPANAELASDDERMNDSMVTGVNSLAVDDQMTGNSVLIREVTLDASGWVTIHEDNDGKPGKILGAQLFGQGTTKNGFVSLLRGTTPGVYYAMIHIDDGNRKFEIASDIPLSIGGNPIMMRFIADETQ